MSDRIRLSEALHAGCRDDAFDAAVEQLVARLVRRLSTAIDDEPPLVQAAAVVRFAAAATGYALTGFSDEQARVESLAESLAGAFRLVASSTWLAAVHERAQHETKH